MTFDAIIIGSGPGGYVAGIRASQRAPSLGAAKVEQPQLGSYPTDVRWLS
jgi:pyruvate/2-oxoglutarate dehydrogenase complex dihydrolipoamide dehydrogenase (E3) component